MQAGGSLVKERRIGPASGRDLHWFYVAMGGLAVIVVLVGFGPGIVAPPLKRYGPPTPLVWLHSAVFAGWLALYIAQTWLVHAGNRALHRKLGWIGAPLALMMVVVGYQTTIALGRRGHGLWWDPGQKLDALGEMVHPLVDLLSFSLLVTAAFLWRRRPDVHKRLILLATVGSLMAAPVAHLLSYFPGLRGVPPVILLPLGLLYFSSAIYDRLAWGRIHPVSLWGGLSLFLVAFVRGAIVGPSSAWHQFASWLVR